MAISLTCRFPIELPALALAKTGVGIVPVPVNASSFNVTLLKETLPVF